MRKVYCDYCGRETEYVDSKVIYGKSYGKIYLCRNCMAYVGVHKGTDKPLGRLANAELRNWKKAAHAVFDPLWKYGRFRGHRNAAYAWLAQKMGSSCLMPPPYRAPIPAAKITSAVFIFVSSQNLVISAALAKGE